MNNTFIPSSYPMLDQKSREPEDKKILALFANQFDLLTKFFNNSVQSDHSANLSLFYIYIVLFVIQEHIFISTAPISSINVHWLITELVKRH